MTTHRVTWIPAPITDSIRLSCTCGWWSNTSVYEWGDKAKVIADELRAAHLAGHENKD
jgi:hypothetical protein